MKAALPAFYAAMFVATLFQVAALQEGIVTLTGWPWWAGVAIFVFLFPTGLFGGLISVAVGFYGAWRGWGWPWYGAIAAGAPFLPLMGIIFGFSGTAAVFRKTKVVLDRPAHPSVTTSTIEAKDGSPVLPPFLFFKSGASAFEIHCKYGQIDELQKGCRRLGLVASDEVLRMPDGKQWVWVRVADREVPFLVRALVNKPAAAPLRSGQLVQWLAYRVEPELRKAPELAHDQRSTWLGAIVAVFAPEMTTATGQFRVEANFA